MAPQVWEVQPKAVCGPPAFSYPVTVVGPVLPESPVIKKALLERGFLFLYIALPKLLRRDIAHIEVIAVQNVQSGSNFIYKDIL